MHAFWVPDSAKGLSKHMHALLHQEVQALVQKKAVECKPDQVSFLHAYSWFWRKTAK